MKMCNFSVCVCYCDTLQFLIKRLEPIAMKLQDSNRRIAWPQRNQQRYETENVCERRGKRENARGRVNEEQNRSGGRECDRVPSL